MQTLNSHVLSTDINGTRMCSQDVYAGIRHMVCKSLSASARSFTGPTATTRSFTGSTVHSVAAFASGLLGASDDKLCHLHGEFCRQKLRSQGQYARNFVLHRALNQQNSTYRSMS